MSYRRFSKGVAALSVAVLVLVLAGSMLFLPNFAKAVGDDITFVETGTGDVSFSSEQYHSLDGSVKLSTQTTSDQGRVRLPFSGTLGDIDSFDYWSYVTNGGTYGQLTVWPSFYLDGNGNGIFDYPAPGDYYLQCEPYYTYENPILDIWQNYNITEMKCESLEGPDCPHSAPTLAQYINGEATTIGCPSNPSGTKFASIAYGSLPIIKIDMRAGYGGPWAGFSGYIDDVNLDGTTYDFSIPTQVFVDNNFDSSTVGWGATKFNKIQDAIDTVASGGTVNVAAGTYVEQIDISKQIVLRGVGAETIIKSPNVLSVKFNDGNDIKPVVYVHDVPNVEISHITVDGDGKGNNNYQMAGIALKNAAGIIDSTTVTGVRETPLNGNQHGLGIYAYNQDGFGREVSITNNIVNDYQKNGIVAKGNGLSVMISGNKVTGVGATNQIAQNSIQVGSGASGTIQNNVVKNNIFTGSGSGNDFYNGWQSGGILVYEAGGSVDVIGNTVENNDMGIYARQTSGLVSIQNNDVLNNLYFGLVFRKGDVTATDNNIVGGEIGIFIPNTRVATVSAPTANSNNVTGYTVYAIKNDATYQTNAQKNYWGVANPNFATILSGNVDYTPWLGATVGTTPMTWYTDDKIQDAIDAASSSDTINVAAGTYTEHITIVKSDLNLVGADKETTIIDATQDPSWPVAKPGILIGEYPLVDGVSGVTVSGFTIRDAAMQEGGVPYKGEPYGVGPGGLAGIQIYGSSDNNIEDNILINNYWQIWLVAEWPSAGYTECKNNRIANNIIMDSENDGVYLYSDGGVFIEDTEIINNEISNAYGTGASGVEFWGWPGGGPYPTIINTVINGNNIHDCTYGVRIREDVSNIAGTSINDNEFQDNTVQVLDEADVLDIQQVLDTNTFDRAVVIDRPEESLLHTIWSKIQDAIDNAQSGDTIEVYDGIYVQSGDLTIDKQVTILGASDSKPTIQFDGKCDNVVIEADDVTLEALRFYKTNTEAGWQGSPTCAANVILDIPKAGPPNYLSLYGGLTIRNSIFEGGSMAMYINSKGDFTLEGSEFIDNSAADSNIIHIAAFEGIATISNNIFTSGNGRAIVVESGPSEQILNGGTMNIIGNTLTSMRSFFVYNHWTDVSKKVNLNIKENTIDETASSAIVLFACGGISLDKFDEITITDNIISNSGENGIFADATSCPAWGIPTTVSGTLNKFSVNQNKIYNSNNYEIKNEFPVQSDAEENYWGTLVKTDIQSKMSDNVDFEPYYIDAAMTTLSSDSQVNLETSTNITTGKTDVVIPQGNAESNITIPLNVTNATLNVAPLLVTSADTKNATLTGKLTIDASTSVGNVKIEIPANTTITGSTAWTGVISVPTVKTSPSATVTATTSGNVVSQVTSVIEIGFGDIELTFDKAVKLVIPGKAGQSAGYTRGGIFTPITDTCPSATSQSQVDAWFTAYPAKKDCKIGYNGDLVIWTRHFTEFVTYTETTAPAGAPAPTGGGGGGGGGIAPYLTVRIVNPVTAVSQSASSSAIYTVDVENTGNVDGTFSLSIDGLPAGYYTVSDPIKLTLIGAGGKTGKLRYTLNLPADAADATFTVIVKAVAGLVTGSSSYKVALDVLPAATGVTATTTTIPAGGTTTTTTGPGIVINTYPITSAVVSLSERNDVRIVAGGVAATAIAIFAIRTFARRRTPWRNDYYKPKFQADVLEGMKKQVKKRFADEDWVRRL